MDSKFDKQLKELLDIENLPDEVKEGDGQEEHQELEDLKPVVYEKKDSSRDIEQRDLKDDYDFARSNYYGLIGRSNAAIDMILKIAQMSEHPRAVEVAANLMKTSADITKELVKLQESVEKIEKQAPPPENNKYVQNNNYYNVPNEKENVMSELEQLKDKPKDGKDNDNK